MRLGVLCKHPVVFFPSGRALAIKNYGVIGVNQHSVVKTTCECLRDGRKCEQNRQTVIDKVNGAVTLAGGGKGATGGCSAACLS